MMADFTIKQNDTRPVLVATLTNGDGAAINLTGATCRFHLRVGSIVLVDAAAEVIDAAAGQVRYVWQEGDTGTVGFCDAEIEVTYADGGVETFPNGSQWSVAITGEIA